MVTVIKKSKDDKKDFSKILQAVNGSNITVYGQKEISVRIGRKEYKIQATIADVEEDILGWDFFNKYKLTFDWSEFGDLYIVDKKAKTRNLLKCVAVPSASRLRASSILDETSFSRANKSKLSKWPR